MITGHVFIATSLDGFVTREDHNLDWLMKQDVAGADQGYDDFIADKDGIIMGSGSFRTVLSFPDWPYEIPTLVMSHSLTQDDIPEDLQDKVQITKLSPVELFKSLEQKGWSKAYIDGGRVVQSFLRAGLIETLCITQAPILLGSGIRLFGELSSDIDLDLQRSRIIGAGLLQSTYTIKR